MQGMSRMDALRVPENKITKATGNAYPVSLVAAMILPLVEKVPPEPVQVRVQKPDAAFHAAFSRSRLQSLIGKALQSSGKARKGAILSPKKKAKAVPKKQARAKRAK